MPLTTTYFGHSIEIEPFEWGYLAHILQPESNTHLVAASSSVFKALEGAFTLIDDAMNSRTSTPATCVTPANPDGTVSAAGC